MDWHLEDDAHHGKDDAQFKPKPSDAVRDHLADHEAEGSNGSHGELLEGAALTFADEAERAMSRMIMTWRRMAMRPGTKKLAERMAGL
jgi:hypothetical protein